MMQGVETKTLYEVGYHLIPTIAEDAVGVEVARAREAIESRGGVVSSEEWPKKIQLAYTISRREINGRVRYTESYFGWARFEMEGKQQANIQEYLRTVDTILRFIVVEVPLEKALPKKRRTKPVLKRSEDVSEQTTKQDEAATEEIDREIEKLMVE